MPQDNGGMVTSGYGLCRCGSKICNTRTWTRKQDAPHARSVLAFGDG